ncbi:uncharacterized protein LOC114351168 [Ostrinia furnacalis]|uniref:uncharacterized protein LOC114351168 n=1 Tax=Ostrinia furnacalis TaxID=93504 RepID=UPI00103AB4D2|nr:uncharacterized protein LOC114351168 [Ostrinia furnacalis]
MCTLAHRHTKRLTAARPYSPASAWYRLVFWLAFPLGVLVILSGGLFYSDEARASAALRVAYATVYKPVFQLLVVTLILGCIFKIDTAYRSVVEWRGWTWLGRASYGAFLLHTMFQRGLVGSQPRPTHMSDYYVMTILCATIFLSYAAAAALWLTVEAPAAGLVKTALAPAGNDSKQKTKETRDRTRDYLATHNTDKWQGQANGRGLSLAPRARSLRENGGE